MQQVAISRFEFQRVLAGRHLKSHCNDCGRLRWGQFIQNKSKRRPILSFVCDVQSHHTEYQRHPRTRVLKAIGYINSCIVSFVRETLAAIYPKGYTTANIRRLATKKKKG